MGQGLVMDELIATALASLLPGDMILVAEADGPVPGNIPRVDLTPEANVLGLIDALTLVAEHRNIAKYTISRECQTSHLEMFALLFGSVAKAPACEVSSADFSRLAASSKLIVVTGPQVRHANVLITVGEVSGL